MVVGKRLVVGKGVVVGTLETCGVEVEVLCPIPTGDFTPVLDDELRVKMSARVMTPTMTIPVMAISVMCVPESFDVLGSAMTETIGLSSFVGEVPLQTGIWGRVLCASTVKPGENHARRMSKESIY